MEKDVAAKRLEYRQVALRSFLPVWFRIQKNRQAFHDPAFLPLLEEARTNFLLYGFQDEIEPLEAFIRACEQGELAQANDALAVLVPLIRERIRKELEIF